jgi:hypothetical protein
VVWTTKVVVVWPDGTVTDAGTVAAGRLLESATLEPPAGAATLMTTVPIDVLPATTELGVRVKLTGTGGVSVSVPVA